MKRIRLLVVQPTPEQFVESTENMSPDDLANNLPAIREKMTIRYRLMLQSIVRTPMDPRGGVGIEEMEKSLGVLKKIQDAQDNGILELEEDEYRHVIEKLSVAKWGGFDERVVTFVHTLRDASEFVLDAAPGELVAEERTGGDNNGATHEPSSLKRAHP